MTSEVTILMRLEREVNGREKLEHISDGNCFGKEYMQWKVSSDKG